MTETGAEAAVDHRAELRCGRLLIYTAFSPVALLMALFLVSGLGDKSLLFLFVAPMTFIYVPLWKLCRAGYLTAGSVGWIVLQIAAWIGVAVLASVIPQIGPTMFFNGNVPIQLLPATSSRGGGTAIEVRGLDFFRSPIIEKYPNGEFAMTLYTKFGISSDPINQFGDWSDDGDGHKIAAQMTGQNQIYVADGLGNSVNIVWDDAGWRIVKSNFVGQSKSIRKPIAWVARLGQLGTIVMIFGPILTFALLSLAIVLAKGVYAVDQVLAASSIALSILVFLTAMSPVHNTEDEGQGVALLMTGGICLLCIGLLILSVRLLVDAVLIRRRAQRQINELG